MISLPTFAQMPENARNCTAWAVPSRYSREVIFLRHPQVRGMAMHALDARNPRKASFVGLHGRIDDVAGLFWGKSAALGPMGH